MYYRVFMALTGLMFARLPELIGMVACQLTGRRETRNLHSHRWASGAGVLGVLTCITYFHKATSIATVFYAHLEWVLDFAKSATLCKSSKSK